jgi:WD40 repeat protein
VRFRPMGACWRRRVKSVWNGTPGVYSLEWHHPVVACGGWFVGAHPHGAHRYGAWPDGSLLASGSGYPDRTIKLWRVADGALLRTLDGAQLAGVGEWGLHHPVVAGCWRRGYSDRTVKLWRVADGALLRTLEGHTARGVFA